MWQRRALCRLSAISIILIISLYFVVFNRLVKTVILPFGDNASIKGVVLDPYVNRFTGIPFAVPPTGENRWKKPVKLSPMSFQNLKKPYDATRFKDRCLQSYTPSGSEPHPSFSEDCLYLNIWAPSSEPPPGGWPVIVWLHGGWLQFGNAMIDPRHHPHELISQNGYGLNAIVIAPAYRVNLGGNWGFWDQRCALEWVAEYVKYFGGDPENVTLGGVSAGAYSVQAQLFHELFYAMDKGEKPLFKRVWMSSNAILTTPRTLQEASPQFDELCTHLNISLSSVMSEKINKLRELPSSEILSAMEAISNPIFRPTLDNDFLSKSLMDSLYSGTLAIRFHQRNMKLLIGEVEHEEITYAFEAPKSPLFLLPALEKYYRTNTVKTLIPHYEEKYKDVSWLYAAIVTDIQVRASTRTLIYCLVAGGVPMKDILRYRISLPIKEVELFNGKVPHSFDFMHWWYTKRVGYSKIEDQAIREWLHPFSNFVKGKVVEWGTTNMTQYRHLKENSEIEVVLDKDWDRLIEIAAIVRKAEEKELGLS